MDIRKFWGQTRALSSTNSELSTDPEATDVSNQSESGDVLSTEEGFLLLSCLLSDSTSIELCLYPSPSVTAPLNCVSKTSLPSDLTTKMNDMHKREIVMTGPAQPCNCHFPKQKYNNSNL